MDLTHHKASITEKSVEELEQVLTQELGMKRFVLGQLLAWVYKRFIPSFDQMTDISKESRERLAAHFDLSAVAVEEVQRALDGTCKMLCSAQDGARFECVLIPSHEGRITACLSTQVGCAMGCAFCRTAGMGFVRNLSQGEILGQLIELNRISPAPITNVVLMGMGEPLNNLEGVTRALAMMLDTRALCLSKRRITLSTSGLLPELMQISQSFDIKFAISLNATTNEVRSQLMPINTRYPIECVMEAARDYSKRSRHRMTFEYVLIGGINDSKDDAKRLLRLLEGMRAKINLIPLNPFMGSDLKAPDPQLVQWWVEFLSQRGVQVNLRASRGQEILAACGQLAAKRC